MSICTNCRRELLARLAARAAATSRSTSTSATCLAFSSRSTWLMQSRSIPATSTHQITSPRRHLSQTASPTPGSAPTEPPQPFVKPTTPALSSIKPIASQPLSTPHIAPSSTTKPVAAKDARKVRKLQGSIPGGEELRGIGYLKAKPKIMAKEDDEYPDWLWTLLDEPRTTMGMPKADLTGIYLPLTTYISHRS